MTIRLLIFALFFIFNLFSAQESDTIIVYEEITVYDTVYIKDEISQKIPLKKKEFPKTKNDIAENNFEFGISALSGTANSNFLKSLNERNQIGFGGGIYLKKSFANNRLLLSISANYLQWLKTFEIDANKEDSDLNGYYFTESDEPVLFQKLHNQSTEIIIPVKVYFNVLRNFSAYIGISGHYTTYKMGFLVPKNFVLNKYADFKTKNISLGWISGLQYSYKKWGISIEYQQNEFQDLRFESANTSPLNFEFNNGFVNKKVFLGLHYSFGKF